MDLSKFSAVDSIDVTIFHPAFEDGQEPVFTMAGPCHPATKKAEKARAEAILKARGKSYDMDRLSIELVASRVLGWKNVTWEGAALPWSPENAVMLLQTPALKFVRDQIAIALADDESFFKA